MAIYHYHDSLIDRVEVHSRHPGQAQATIVAAAGADAGTLEKIREALSAKSISSLMDAVDGKPAIQVRGIKNEKKLLAELETLGFAHGRVEREATPDDYRKPGFRERVRGKALFLSAIFYHIGNAAFFVSSIQRGRHNEHGKMSRHDISEMLIGGSFAVGDTVMTFYGGDKGDEELQAAAHGLKRHLHQKGIEVPRGDELNPDTLHEKGVAKATDRWLRKHTIHIKCLAEMAGGLFTIHSAMKHDTNRNKNNSKIAAGLLITAGWLATFLLDKSKGERIFDKDSDPASATLAEKMIDNPRGWIARPLGMANNVANLVGVYGPHKGERKRFRDELDAARESLRTDNSDKNRATLARMQAKQHDYVWNVVSACSFLVAHTLFGISGSKRPKETEDDKSMMNDLVLLSANVLAQQPEAVRRAAIGETAEYVSRLEPVNMRKDEVEAAIRGKIESLTKSNWVARAQLSAQAQQPSVQL